MTPPFGLKNLSPGLTKCLGKCQLNTAPVANVFVR